jgi:hypothetical protein
VCLFKFLQLIMIIRLNVRDYEVRKTIGTILRCEIITGLLKVCDLYFYHFKGCKIKWLYEICIEPWV